MADNNSELNLAFEEDGLSIRLPAPSISLYRACFRLTPNYGFRKDIKVTISNLDLWKQVLEFWKSGKHNPLNIKGLLQEYEYRERKLDTAKRRQSRPDAETLPTGIPFWRRGEMFQVRRRMVANDGTGSSPLDEVLSEALRAAHRTGE